MRDPALRSKSDAADRRRALQALQQEVTALRDAILAAQVELRVAMTLPRARGLGQQVAVWQQALREYQRTFARLHPDAP